MDITEAAAAFSRRNPGATVTVVYDPHGAVAVVGGSMEFQVSHDLQQLLSLVIDGLETGKRLEVDLSGVGYICSMGVGALINTMVAARARGVSVEFSHAQPGVVAVLELLGLSEYLPLRGADD